MHRNHLYGASLAATILFCYVTALTAGTVVSSQKSSTDEQYKKIELYTLLPILMEKTPFPLVLAQLIAAYHGDTIAGERFPIINRSDYSYQRVNDGRSSLTMLGADNTYQFPFIAELHAFHAVHAVRCPKGNPHCGQESLPQHWDTNNITTQSLELYPMINSSESHIHVNAYPNKSRPSLPQLTIGSVYFLDWLIRCNVIMKKRTDLEVEEAQAISAVETANNMGMYEAIQLVRNGVLCIQRTASQFPDKRFPKTSVNSDELNRILDNYKRHEPWINTYLSDESRILTPVFYTGEIFEECVQYAQKRRKNNYKFE